MLSAFLLFWSGNLDFGSLTFHLGPTGYLSYLIPLVTLACGALVWASPPQRMFYAIVGLLTVVYSLIGLNFGGWVIGLVTGVIGAGLSFAWIPDKRKPVPATGPTVNAYRSAAQTHGAHDDAEATRTDRPIGAHALPDSDDDTEPRMPRH